MTQKYCIKLVPIKQENSNKRMLWISHSLPKQISGVMIKLLYDKEEVGYVDVLKTKFGFYETHSWIDEEHRGKGFGKKLYARAFEYVMHKKQEIRSSTSPSIQAAQVWLSRELNNRYHIVKRKRRFCVTGRKKAN